MDWQAKRLEGKIFAVRTGTLYLFSQLTYIYIYKSKFEFMIGKRLSTIVFLITVAVLASVPND